MSSKIWIVIVTIISFVLSYNAYDYYYQFSDRVFLSSLIIQFISIVSIFSRKDEPFSLFKMFYLFSFFFFGIAPLLQFYNKSQFFGATALKEIDYFLLNILIIFILLSFGILYNWCRGLKSIKKKNHDSSKYLKRPRFNFLQTIMLVLLSFLSFFFVLRANDFSFMSMLFRGGEFKSIMTLNQIEFLVVFRFIQPLSILAFYVYWVSTNRNGFIVFVLAIIALITCFPLSMPRFSAAALYIPFLLLIVPSFKKQNVFTLVFVLGLLVIFPFLNNFRTLTSDSTIKFKVDTSMFISGHFDSYQNFALVVSNDIITWGRQLLGVLFFWIPRSIWPNKPIGSGAYLAEELGFSFTNVSCNFFAEGYINFGFIGVILFVFLLSYITALLDGLYWNDAINNNNKVRFIDVIYYTMIGMIFFILRGDLMSSFAYLMGMFASFYILNLISGTDKIKTSPL